MSPPEELKEVVGELKDSNKEIRRSVDNLSRHFTRHIEKEDERHELLVRVSEKVELLADPRVPCAKLKPNEERVTKLESRLSKNESTTGYNKWIIRIVAGFLLVGALAGTVGGAATCQGNREAEASTEQGER